MTKSKTPKIGSENNALLLTRNKASKRIINHIKDIEEMKRWLKEDIHLYKPQVKNSFEDWYEKDFEGLIESTFDQSYQIRNFFPIEPITKYTKPEEVITLIDKITEGLKTILSDLDFYPYQSSSKTTNSQPKKKDRI